jgi:carbonic anhydrase
VRKSLAAQRLRTHGWVYDMSSGEIRVVQPGSDARSTR